MFLVVILAVIVGLVLLYIYVSRREPGESVNYAINLGGEQGDDLSWGRVSLSGITGKDEFYEVEVYKSEPYELDEVDEVVVGLNFGSSSPEEVLEDEFYTWSSLSEGTGSYNLKTGDFFFESTDSLRLREIERGYIDEDTAVEYFGEFVKQYLGLETDIEAVAEDTGVNINITGEFVVNGYSIVSAVNQRNNVSAVFTKGGNLVSLFISLTRFSKSDSSVRVMGIPDLKKYIKGSAYPKESFVNIIPSDDYDCPDYDCFSSYSAADITDVIINSASVVYYWNPTKSGDVLPTYELEGEGVYIDEDENVSEVSVIVYANAVDPSQIYLPD